MLRVYEILIAISVVIFVLGMILPFDAIFGLIPSEVLNGEIWRIITSMFLHGSISHIVMNMLALYFFGMVLEPMIGSRNFFAVYLGGGLMGGLFVMLFSISPFSFIPGLGISQNSNVVGASGAIFAIGTILAILSPNMRVGFLFFPIGTTLLYLIILWFFLLIIISLFGAPIANSGHLGGIIAGIIAAKFLMTKRDVDFYY